MRIDARVPESDERTERAGAVAHPAGSGEMIERFLEQNQSRQVRGIVTAERTLLEHRPGGDEKEQSRDRDGRQAHGREQTPVTAPPRIENPPESERRNDGGERPARSGEIEHDR